MPTTELLQLKPEERQRRFTAGEMTHHECALWASLYPEEVPSVEDEYPWIVCDLVDNE